MDQHEVIGSWIDDYFAALAEEYRSSGIDPKLRTPRPAVDITEFFGLVGLALKYQQEIDGTKVPLLYTEQFPEVDDNLKTEVISYSLLQRMPGTFEKTSAHRAMSEGNIRQMRPLVRESIIDPDYPGFKIFTLGQWFDNKVAFEIYARDNRTANQRALWFESFMENWMWYFKASGVQQIAYEGRGSDAVLSPDNRKIVVRPLVYYVRTEKIRVIKEHVLRSIITTTSSPQ